MVTQKDGTAFPGWYRLLSAFLKGCYNFLALLTLGAFRILEGSCQLRNSCHSATGGWLGLHGSTCSCVARRHHMAPPERNSQDANHAEFWLYNSNFDDSGGIA